MEMTHHEEVAADRLVAAVISLGEPDIRTQTVVEAAEQRARCSGHGGWFQHLRHEMGQTERLRADGLSVTLDMAVARLGGLVNGRPTSRTNFLQRIDRLVELENQGKMPVQQPLFEPHSNDARSAFEPPSLTGSGARFELEVDGRDVSGLLDLDKPNARGQRSCRVQYRTPTHWRNDLHRAALRIAAHWFRDLGGFGVLTHRELCHIIARLPRPRTPGVSESQSHAAIDAYAASDWHRERKSWTTIRRFFDRRNDHLATWLVRGRELQVQQREARRRVGQARRRAQQLEQERRQAAATIRRATPEAIARMEARARAAGSKARADEAEREQRRRRLADRMTEQAATLRNSQAEAAGTPE